MAGAEKFVVYVVKLVRAMAMWVAIYVVEKAYLAAYVDGVVIGGASGAPPDLRLFMAYALAIESAVFLVVLLLLTLLYSKYKTPWNTFAIDGLLVSAILSDYAFSTGTIAAIGVGLGAAMQDKELMRYRDDGMRGIRAYANVMLVFASTILAVPFFAIGG